MAASVSPEKVKELLSSFLLSHIEFSHRTSTITEASENRHSDPTVEATVQSSNNLAGSLRSFEKFLQRLDTFSAVTWFGKPAELSPIICARYGWQNVESDMLQCVGCKAVLSAHLPSRLHFDAYEASVRKLKTNLLASHDKFCLLAANPCPDHFCHVPLDNPGNLLTGFSERIKSLSRIQDKLPQLDQTDLQALGYDVGQAAVYCRRNLVTDVDASPQVVALAFAGWTCRVPDENILTCSMCRRQVGLWNFVMSACPASSVVNNHQTTTGVDDIQAATLVDNQTTTGVDDVQATIGVDNIQATTGVDDVQTTTGVDDIQATTGVDNNQTTTGVDDIQATTGVDNNQTTTAVDNNHTTTGVNDVQAAADVDDFQAAAGVDDIQATTGVDDGQGVMGDGQPTSKRRKISLCRKETLNPLGEHHRWCPWVQEVPLSSSSSSSPGHTADCSSLPDMGKPLPSSPAFIIALRCIAPGLMDNNKRFVQTMKTSPVVEGLRHFRKVLQAWSSPKVNMTMPSTS